MDINDNVIFIKAMTNCERLKEKMKEDKRMEMCYDGALVLPNSFAVLDKEEMVYVEGGGSITINRTTVNKALNLAFNAVSVYCMVTGKSGLEVAKAIGKKIAGAAFKVGKALLRVKGFAGFALQAAAYAIVGFVAACAMTIGIVYATNTTLKIGW